MKTFKFGEKTITVKQSWNALTTKEMLLSYAVITTIEPDFRELFVKKLLLVEVLTGISTQDWYALEFELKEKNDIIEAQNLHAEMMLNAVSTVDWFFEKVSENEFTISTGLTRCPFPKLYGKEAGAKTFFAPADGLENVSFYELTQIIESYNATLSGQDLIAIDELIALIYRPSKKVTGKNKRNKFDGDRRMPLLNNEERIHKRRKIIQHIPTEVKQIIMFWIACCLNKITSKYTLFFSEAQENYEKTNSYGWAAVMLKLSGGVVNLDAVANTHYSNVLLQLEIMENEQMNNKES